MPVVKKLEIKESQTQLKAFLKKANPTVYKRILMLRAIKRNKGESISKRSLAVQCGIDPNSVTNWKKLYEVGGIASILNDGRIGFKPSYISKENHALLEKKLNDPTNGINGYTELLAWVKEILNLDLAYITLVKYCQRHFNTKIKVARKSHIKKDKEAGEIQKKTLVRSVPN